MKYPHIDTLFKRDPITNNIILFDFTQPEFSYLQYNTWVGTEKIDGTNIRVYFESDPEVKTVRFAGRTDNADIPKPLLKYLEETFTVDELQEKFGDTDVCLYGEGFGGKIQSGGNYRPTPGFILFDVRIGNFWLNRTSLEDIAASLNIPIVPIIKKGSLYDLISYVEQGFVSHVAEKPSVAEGLVIQPEIPLLRRNGERIITKLKFKDFEALRKENK